MNILKCHHHPIKINGLAIYQYGSAKVKSPGVIITTFNYYAQKSCLQYLQGAIKCTVFMGSFSIAIESTVFANLSYYGRLNAAYHDNTRRVAYFSITNITVVQNIGYGYLKMFSIVADYYQVFSNDSNYLVKVESVAGFS